MVNFEEHTFKYGDDKQTYYLAAGSKLGPLLIFVHGWPAIAKTWRSQLETFANLGFRVIAPDMPGYGGSTARKRTEDYCQEEINLGMVALLDHLGRKEAVWIGHDWGCGAVWSFAAHFPDKCVGVAGLAVPAFSVELGLEHEISTVNREQYPEHEYPYGQWSYQKFYEEDFEKATAWFDKDPAAFIRAGYAKGSPQSLGKPAITANVVKDGGWFGGVPTPDPEWSKIPIENLCIDEETFQELTAAMKKTGFWGADAWYANHKLNKAYYDEKKTNDGYLHMPTLFIQAKYDTICDTATSGFADLQRKYCTHLTEASIAAGHWVAQEKPEEVNGVIARWILESLPKHWPGYWSQGFTRSEIERH